MAALDCSGRSEGAITSGARTSFLYDRALSPMYDALANQLPNYIAPNAITAAGGMACTASLAAMHYQLYHVAGVLFTIYHVLDNIDGKQARKTGKTSRLGHILDHAIDGTVGITASCHSCCFCLFGFPFALPFALRCGMATLLTCHIAEYTSGRPTLGSRFFSADELFLLNSLALFWKGTRSSSLLVLDNSFYIVVQFFWVLSISALALTTVNRLNWLVYLVFFATLCALTSSWHMPVFVYSTTMTFLLISNSKRHH